MYILSTPLVLNTKILAKRLFVSRLFVWGKMEDGWGMMAKGRINKIVEEKLDVTGDCPRLLS